ncbi:hypothetical protein [Spirosoma endophyticum]|uniref:Uncharacterized protein n=1 Tax=Spirosoma endophyticum TaxID=662367 RepID=A0A1I2B9W7_9BACT|nr:hypothetical protein [Spirosoma endophyticum]SFE52093.1 hypothetical protein SAMN05216167_11515 [Spirosoma endophyticum]
MPTISQEHIKQIRQLIESIKAHPDEYRYGTESELFEANRKNIADLFQYFGKFDKPSPTRKRRADYELLERAVSDVDLGASFFFEHAQNNTFLPLLTDALNQYEKEAAVWPLQNALSTKLVDMTGEQLLLILMEAKRQSLK